MSKDRHVVIDVEVSSDVQRALKLKFQLDLEDLVEVVEALLRR